MPEFRYVTCDFCQQTYLSNSADQCSLCCKSGGLVESLPPPPMPESPETDRNFRRGGVAINSQVTIGVMMIAGGAFILGLGLLAGNVTFLSGILVIAGIGAIIRGIRNKGTED